MTQAKRLSHVRLLIKLKQQEEIMEDSIESFLVAMKVDFDVLQSILQKRRLDNIQRKKLIVLLRNSMSSIASDFDTVESMINQLNECGKIDVEECKSRLLSLSKRINDVQPAAELEALEKEQKEIEEFLNEFSFSIAKYDAKKKAMCIETYKHLSKNRIDGDDIINYEEIKDFNCLIVKTGHYQHWKEEDHIFFLKVRKKCPNIPAIVSEIQKKFPDMSAEKIINHEAWYKVYLALREKQRNSVKEWRKKKESEKKEKLESFKLSDNYKELSNIKEAPSNKIKKSSNANNVSKMKDPIIKKEQIKIWKIQKENSKIADDERLKSQAPETQNWKEKQFLIRSMNIKSAVRSYREQKQETKFNSLKNKSCNKIIKSATLIKSFRQEDEKYFERRNKQLKIKNNNEESCSKKQPSTYERNGESTLLNSTKNWEEKCKPPSPKSQIFRTVLFIKDIPKLSTCYYRNQKSSIFT